MDGISRFFVQQPLHILAVAFIHLALWTAVRSGRIPAVRHPGVLLVPALAWLAYAAWEWLVLVRTPEANIRVDLLMIWPLLMLTTLWAAVRAFRA
jgi:hypothetical protein